MDGDGVGFGLVQGNYAAVREDGEVAVDDSRSTHMG